MTKQISRRYFLGALLSGAASMAVANPPTSSIRPVARPEGFVARGATPSELLIAKAKLGGRLGYAVVDVKTGKLLEGHNASSALPPASVAKTVTALYALQTLGADYRFDTSVIATGPIQNGVLAGDLILAGGGDPTLDTDALATLAAKLKKTGLREVKGQFLVYGGALAEEWEIDPEQPPHVGYNPAISGLNLNYNRVHFEWKRQGNGFGVSMDARSANYRPDVDIARMKIVARDVPVYTYADRNGIDDWTVARGALGNGGARWLPVRRPALYAGEVFQTFARSHGIVLKAPKQARSGASGTAIAQVQSAPLQDILRDMLKYSTNLTAEVVGMTATKKRKGSPVGLRSSARAMSQWAAQSLGMSGVKFVDHSGLGDKSRVEPGALAKALVRARAAGLEPILKDIPMLDGERRVIRDHPVQVKAKTGTLNFVSGLAGYVKGRNGRELAFAIFAGDMAHRARLSEAERERPQGARSWNRRAKVLQQDLIERWEALYAS